MKRSLLIICLALFLCAAVSCSYVSNTIGGIFGGNSDNDQAGVPGTDVIIPDNDNAQTPDDTEKPEVPGDQVPEEEKPEIPEETLGNSATGEIADVLDEKNALASGVNLVSENGLISATLPEGALVAEGATSLTFSVKELEESAADITLAENESSLSVDVHIEGLSPDNETVIKVYIKALLPIGLNMGNYSLYHVENGETVLMTLLGDEEPVHNSFEYDPVTGDTTMYLKSFSEIALVSNEVNPWEGNLDYSWFTPGKGEYTIANADQLAAFSAIVGGMSVAKDANGNLIFAHTYKETEEGVEYTYHDYSFAGETVTLIADINLGDDEANNNSNIIFYPIGYWNSEETYEKTNTAISSGFYTFEGTFNGNGNTIKNFYQNTWEMKGDHDWYSPEEQYYRDGMGLFGKVYGATIKNLTVENFSSDGEIATTGVIAAYADSANGKSARFENITILNCNPRVYNIGNGGIVGCAGWYSRNSTDVENVPVIFKNITVDQTNKISALWGTYDVSCGGILGQYYPDSKCGISFDNCHVAAVMDVHNDVCANYQYYWYRYSGMFIGTIRANTKDSNGYTVADTTGITATNCTYTYGDWNEYWYCELVKNSLASYTHDHQFSRLTTITSLSEIQDENGNWNKEGNFVIPNADNTSAECYHIFKNSEGNLYQHFHDVADESNPEIFETKDINGDGELNDLKEDRTCYFMPFNQVFNGLGYGVKPTYEYDGFTEVENGPVKSEQKFEALGTVATYRPGVSITLGQLVGTIVDDSKLSKTSIFAAVSPLTENDVVSATFSLDLSDWTNSTITFTEGSTGSAKIVITDYFYCAPTVIYINAEQAGEKFTANTIEAQNAYTQITLGTLFDAKNSATIGNVTATVTDPNGNETTVTGSNSDWASETIDLTSDGVWTVLIQDDDTYCAITKTTFTVNKVDKFNKVFTNENFTYRVGNGNAIVLSSLFSEIETAVGISSVNISVAGTPTHTFISNSEWKKGTVDFDGTGFVTVTISADGANDYSLYLEVVNAVNATSAASATSNNVVLLQNAGFSSLKVSGGYTLYGNGFTLTSTSDDAALDIGYAYVTLENGTLDNVQIVCPNFDYAVLYPSNAKDSGNRNVTTDKIRYYNVKSAIISTGNSRILNSRISGGRAAVYATGGNLVIDNSRIELGAAANIHVGAAVSGLTLKDVTLIQRPTQATVGDTSKTLMGVSIIVMADNQGNTTPITIEGELSQYAWAHEGYSGYVPEKGKSLVSTVMSQENYIHSVKYEDGQTYDSVNLGIIFMPEDTTAVKKPTIDDSRTNNPYSFVEINNVSWIYTIGNSNIVSNLDIDADMSNIGDYVPNAQGDALPLIEYNDLNEDRILSSSYNVDKGWIYKLSVNLDNGAYTFSFANLVITKAGVEYDYTLPAGVSNTIQVEEGTTEYILTANIDGVYHNVYFQLIGTASSKEAPQWSNDANGTTLSSSSMNASWAAGVCVASSYGGTWSGAAPALSNVYVRYYSTDAKAYKVINLADYTPTTKGQLNGTNQTYTIEGSDFTLTLTGGQVHSSNKVNAMPVVVQDGNTYTLYFVASASNGLVNSGNSARTVPVTYSFTDGLGNTLTGSHTWSVEENKDDQYKYSDFCNGTLTKLENCITPDTLITLADGTQVRVDSLTGSEELLVWNLETGKLDKAPIMFVDSDAEAEYEIIHLYLSDGTEVKVIGEHGFWDYDLNKYVYLDRNAADYIGHTFAKQNGDKLEKVQLTNVVIETEITTAWSPVTVGHLCYFVNGMLSMPGGVGGLFNIFEVDAETMTYDYEAMARDIDTYGLYTYEEMNAICPLSEEMFNAAGGAYLKISIGKGNLTIDELIYMINRYSKFV